MILQPSVSDILAGIVMVKTRSQTTHLRMATIPLIVILDSNYCNILQPSLGPAQQFHSPAMDGDC